MSDRLAARFPAMAASPLYSVLSSAGRGEDRDKAEEDGEDALAEAGWEPMTDCVSDAGIA